MPGQPRTRSGQNIYGKSGPPAPNGNRRSVHHGGMVTSKSHGEEMAAKETEIMEALSEAAPVRAPDGSLPRHDIFAVRLLAMEWVRYENMSAYLIEYGWLDEDGEPRHPVSDLIGKSADRITRLLDRMGMTPASRAKLGLDLVKQATFAEAMSEPNRKRRMRMLRDAGVIDVEEVEDEQ
jgi:phage terminase small subunit